MHLNGNDDHFAGREKCVEMSSARRARKGKKKKEKKHAANEKEAQSRDILVIQIFARGGKIVYRYA